VGTASHLVEVEVVLLVQFTWDRTTGQNGEKLHLSITVKDGSPLLGKVHPFVIESSKTGDFSGRTNAWLGLVTE